MECRELNFVHVTGNTKEDVYATNKVVRAHVMRRYKQQQRISRGHKEDTRSSANKAIQRHPLPSLRLTSCLDGELDPFQSLPVRLTRRELMLLQQNASSVIRTSVHEDPLDLYTKVCSKDPAWLFMNMFYASNRFAVASKSHPSEDIAYLLQSISALNQSIARSPDTISDSTIATVACLANVENLNGVASHAAVHIQGLYRMVELRGGLEKLGMRGALRRQVLWSDLLDSSSSERPARFPFYPVDQTAHLSAFIPSASREDFLIYTNPDIDEIATARNKIRVSQILLSLHELSTFLNIVGTRELPWEAAYPDRVYEVEYQIVASLFDDSIRASTDVKAELGVLLLRASLLFIYTNSRETPVGASIREKLIARLHRAFDSTDIEKIALLFPAEVLWIVLIGATSTTFGECQLYFSQLLRRICANHYIRTQIDIKVFLAGLPTLVRYRWSLLRGIFGDDNSFG